MKEVSLPNTLGSVVLLLICLIAVNVMASFIPLRFDLTEERLYTISEPDLNVKLSIKLNERSLGNQNGNNKTKNL